MKTFPYKIILASQSPRRQMLLKGLGFEFEHHVKEIDESFPAELQREYIPMYLAQLKADAFTADLDETTIVITADTVVWVDNSVLNKPADEKEAKQMLKLLSGKRHEVITGVCLKTKHRQKAFYAVTEVFFKELKSDEIDHYVRTFKPFDKAGAYGAQEWIGYIGIEKIKGSFFNVMGLPVKELYEELWRMV